MAAAAICAASCNDSAGTDEESTVEHKTEQTVLRFEIKPDGTQTVREEKVETDLPDPVARTVEKDQHGTCWVKIYHDPVPFADGSKDTTGLLREYAYINLDKNQVMSQERFESGDLKLSRTDDTVYWHPASPYSFDGFWSDKAELNKDEAMNIHANTIDAFAQENAKDTSHTHGAQGSWDEDTTQTKPVHTHSGGSGHYVFVRSYYPYAYHGYESAPLGGHSNRFAGSSLNHANTNRFSTLNVFRNKALSMTSRISHNKTFHFSSKMRTPTVRGHFSSRGISFGS